MKKNEINKEELVSFCTWIKKRKISSMFTKDVKIAEIYVSEKESKNIDIKRRELFNDFYAWLDSLSVEEYDDMSLTQKCEKYFFEINK